MDRAVDLDELRRLAYSRSGTEDDRRRLAHLEASIRAVAPTPPVSADVIVDELGDHGAATDEAVADDRSSIHRFRLLAAGLGALVGALLATAITLAVVGASEPEPVEASALAVFDRDPLAIDDPSNLLMPLEGIFVDAEGSTLDDVEDLTLRWVGAPSGYDVYAVRWHVDDEFTVCLIVEGAEGATAACSLETDFIDHGIRMSAFGLDVKWGPSGAEVWVNSLR